MSDPHTPITVEEVDALVDCVSIAARQGRSYEVYGGVEIPVALERADAALDKIRTAVEHPQDGEGESSAEQPPPDFRGFAGDGGDASPPASAALTSQDTARLKEKLTSDEFAEAVYRHRRALPPGAAIDAQGDLEALELLRCDLRAVAFVLGELQGTARSEIRKRLKGLQRFGLCDDEDHPGFSEIGLDHAGNFLRREQVLAALDSPAPTQQEEKCERCDLPKAVCEASREARFEEAEREAAEEQEEKPRCGGTPGEPLDVYSPAFIGSKGAWLKCRGCPDCKGEEGWPGLLVARDEDGAIEVIAVDCDDLAVFRRHEEAGWEVRRYAPAPGGDQR